MVRTEPHPAWVDRHARWHTWATGSLRFPPVGVNVAVVGVALRATLVDAASFTDSLPQGVFTPRAQPNARNIDSPGRAVVGASAGFVYRCDWETGSFSAGARHSWTTVSRRARSSGVGRLAVSASYQRVQIDTLERMDIGDLSDTQAPIFSTPTRGPQFTISHFALNLGTNQVTIRFTYCMTDDLEINPAVPVLQSDLDHNVALQRTGATHFPVERFGKRLLPPTSVTDWRGESRGVAYELSGLRDQRLQHRELRYPEPAARRRGRYEQHLLCWVPLREHDDNDHDNLDRPVDEHKGRPRRLPARLSLG